MTPKITLFYAALVKDTKSSAFNLPHPFSSLVSRTAPRCSHQPRTPPALLNPARQPDAAQVSPHHRVAPPTPASLPRLCSTLAQRATFLLHAHRGAFRASGRSWRRLRPRPATHQPPTGRHECCFILDPSRWRTPLLWSWHYRPIERSFFAYFITYLRLIFWRPETAENKVDATEIVYFGGICFIFGGFWPSVLQNSYFL